MIAKISTPKGHMAGWPHQDDPTNRMVGNYFEYTQTTLHCMQWSVIFTSRASICGIYFQTVLSGLFIEKYAKQNGVTVLEFFINDNQTAEEFFKCWN